VGGIEMAGVSGSLGMGGSGFTPPIMSVGVAAVVVFCSSGIDNPLIDWKCIA
jgi:hypothetical protein